MDRNDSFFPSVKKYDPMAAANIGIEALSYEARQRGTSYGKLVAQLNEEEKKAIVEAYKEAQHA